MKSQMAKVTSYQIDDTNLFQGGTVYNKSHELCIAIN